jgi:hypothetical protein
MNKKQFRKEIESKLDTIFGYLAIGSEKKFSKVIKKAALILTDELHKKEIKPKKAAPKKNKKVVTKKKNKLPEKKAIVKAEKKVTVKKATVKSK